MRSLLFFLLIVGIFVGVMIAYSRFQQMRMRAELIRKQQQNAQNQKENTEQPMVKCEHCGTYLPQTDALANPENSEQHFCSKEHKQAFLERK